MRTSTKTPDRRTRQAISLLSVDAVTSELVAVGIRPVEFVTISDEEFLNHTMPRLEPHQRFDWAEYAPRATDPFVPDYYKRNPPDDLRTTWKTQLYDHELQTFVDGLSRPQLMAHLKEITVDEHFDRKPEPTWSADQYRNELASRIRELESAVPTKHRRKK